MRYKLPVQVWDASLDKRKNCWVVIAILY